MDNPFDYGHALDPAQLVDRIPEVEEVHRTLLAGGTLFLIGPRRFGKTSILKAAEAAAVAAGAVVIRHDAEAYPGLDTLVQAIVLSAAKQLRGSVAKVGDLLRRAFAKLRPQVTYDPMLQTWTAGVEMARDASAPHVPLLVDALDGLAALAKASGRKTALILDEFQRVITLGGKDAEGQIRAAIQHHTNVAYVFAGSKTTVLNEMTLNPARPFYRLGARLFIREIPREVFMPFVSHGLSLAKIAAPPAMIERIFTLAEDVPYNVQALAHTVWERARRTGGSTRLTNELVQQAVRDLVSRDDPFYTQAWNGLTPTQQRALLALGREGGRGLQSKEITQRYGVSPAAMRNALLALESRDLVRREERVGEIWWRLEDPFFRVWVEEVRAG